MVGRIRIFINISGRFFGIKNLSIMLFNVSWLNLEGLEVNKVFCLAVVGERVFTIRIHEKMA